MSEIVASEFWSNLIANFKWLTEGLKGKTCLTDKIGLDLAILERDLLVKRNSSHQKYITLTKQGHLKE